MRKTGFTLIELLIVVAIIGILVSLAFPVISQVRESAKKVAAKADMRSVDIAIKEYHSDYRRLPVPNQGTITGVGPDGQRYQIGWMPNVEDPQDSPHIQIYRKVIATLQGDNAEKLNPREEHYLERQEGRPAGMYMDPWSKGLKLEDNPDNRFYQLWLDHDMDDRIHCGTIDNTYPQTVFVNERLSMLRCLGSNRKAEWDLDVEGFDDIFSFEVDRDAFDPSK